MIKKWLTIIAVLGIVGSASAQTLKDYLALRKQYSVSKSSPIEALDGFVGEKVLELKCVVKGSLELGDKVSIYVEYPDNRGEQVIDAKEVPDWLKGGSVAARLLVKATRSQDLGVVQVDLIAAASDSDITNYEKANAPKPEPAQTKRTTTTVKRGSTTSRGGTVKRGVKGDPKVIAIYARFIKNHNKRLSDGKAYEIADAVIRWSLTYDVDARLVVAVLITESDFRPGCISSAGAKGLGQLMDENCEEYGITDVFDTNQNLYGTVRQLREHLDRYKGKDNDPEKLALALAAYNAGPGNVKKYGGIPPYRETQDYIKRVFTRYKQLCSGD